jgi:transposase
VQAIKQYSSEHLIFIDEAGANLQMHPLYVRAPGAQRANISARYQRGNFIAILGAISLKGIESLSYTNGPGNTEVFGCFIENYLCPMLTSKHVVVIDKVPFHKAEKIKNMIKTTGAKLIYSSPYSPEFNPIEQMCSKVKSSLRKFAARTKTEFHRAIIKALKSITQSNLFGWFKHAEYIDQDFRKPL